MWFDEVNLAAGRDRDYETTKAVSAADVVPVCFSGGDVPVGMRFALDVADAQPAGTTLLIPAQAGGV